MKTNNVFSHLFMVAALTVGIMGCSSDSNDETKIDDIPPYKVEIVDFSKYEDPCEVILGTWDLTVSTSPAHQATSIVFYSDKTWKAGGWIGSKDQGSYSIVDNRMNVKDATEYEWLLRLNYSEEDCDTFGLVVAENMMYLSTLGDNDTKTFYEFQHRSEK